MKQQGILTIAIIFNLILSIVFTNYSKANHKIDDNKYTPQNCFNYSLSLCINYEIF